MAKKRNEAFSSQAQRLASRARTIGQIDKLAPKMKFQQRRNMAALSQSLAVKRLSGGQSALPPVVATAGNIAPQATFETSRQDEGYPVSLPATNGGGAKPPAAPQRADDHGRSLLAEEIDFDAIGLDEDDGFEADGEISPDEDPDDAGDGGRDRRRCRRRHLRRGGPGR